MENSGINCWLVVIDFWVISATTPVLCHCSVVIYRCDLGQEKPQVSDMDFNTGFCVSHMVFEDGLSLDGIALFVFFLASGSLLTWVFLNFGLIKVILFHSVYNLIAFLLYLIVLNYGFDDSKKSTCIEDHNTCIEWQRKPLWQTQTSKINLEDSQFLVSNGEINSILDVMPDLDIEHYEYEILQGDKIKYDILIFNKNDSTLKNSQILKAMESAGLIKMSAK